MAKKVKLSDIAEVLGVSNVTVSKALANKEGVSEELRKKIKIVANDMGYTMHSKTASYIHHTIAMLIGEQYLADDYSFYWNLYKFVVESLKNHQEHSVLEIISQEDEEQVNLPGFLVEKQVDGVFVFGKTNTIYLQALQNLNIPTVLLDFYDLNVEFTSVDTDNFNDFYRLTEFLIQKGYRNIGFVGSVTATNGIQDRYLGYYKSLLSHDMKVQNDWIIEDREEMLFKKTFILPKQMPDAFVCSCDQSAYYFMKHLQENGYKIPEDVAVIGYYDFVYSRLCVPPLTTVHVDLKNMAKEGVKALMNIIKEGNDVQHVSIKGELIERESV